MVTREIENDITSLRFFFNGRGHFKASRALELAIRIHNGLRKDGKTPEYHHQLCITHHLRTLANSLSEPEYTFCTALLHDSVEDHPDKVTLDRIEDLCGVEVRDAVELLTKTGKVTDHYFGSLRFNPIASIVKAADRVHNFQTMVGVFSIEKQGRYIGETEEFIIPMLEEAALRFPEQEPAYANLKLVLKSQIELIKHIHIANS